MEPQSGIFSVLVEAYYTLRGKMRFLPLLAYPHTALLYVTGNCFWQRFCFFHILFLTYGRISKALSDTATFSTHRTWQNFID